MHLPTYPNDFYSSKNGVKISEETINEWIEDMITYMEDHEDCSYHYTSSGNTMVVIIRSAVELDGNKYEIKVCSNYHTGYIH